MVREAAVAVTVEKYGINLTFLLLFASFLFSFSFVIFVFFYFIYYVLYSDDRIPNNNGLKRNKTIQRHGAIIIIAAAKTTISTNAFEQHHSYGARVTVR